MSQYFHVASALAGLVMTCMPAGLIAAPTATAATSPATATAPESALTTSATPLPFPMYVASRISGAITIDGNLTEAAWRETALGWGLSHSIEPNVLCPDATLFRIGYDDKYMYLALAGYQREVPEPLPDHLWKPQETDLVDIQAVPRHARERGVEPPVNTVQVLISTGGRTVTLTFDPPKPPTAKVHDAVGEHDLKLEIEHAYQGGPKDELWTAEARIAWTQLGFTPPVAGDDWALNVYRDIRFFSNWAFIAWMRDWRKAEYSRYEMTDRFGRLIFIDAKTAPTMVEDAARKLVGKRGPVRVFTNDALLLFDADGNLVRQRYADYAKVLRAYANGIRDQRGQIGNDLPYYPFHTEKAPRPHLSIASRKLVRLQKAAAEKPLLDDPASTVARISHAIPEAREGLYTYKKERLYRGLPK